MYYNVIHSQTQSKVLLLLDKSVNRTEPAKVAHLLLYGL